MSNSLSSLFTYSDVDLSLSQDEEVEAIRAAQAGDEAAKERLLLAYGPLLRSSVSRFTRGVRDDRDPWAGSLGMGTAAFGQEDAESAAIVGFLDALLDHDPEQNPRLAGRASTAVTRALSDLFEETMPFFVPERTLSRFYGILREFDGDADLAVEHAPEFSMTRETFLTVLGAVRGTGSLDEAEGDRDEEGGRPDGGAASFYGDGSESFADVEDRILVEAAFQAVDDDEERIVSLAYGFRGTEDYAMGEPVPDGVISTLVGMTRPTVQRRRAGALDKMRKALGALPEEEWKTS